MATSKKVLSLGGRVLSTSSNSTAKTLAASVLSQGKRPVIGLGPEICEKLQKAEIHKLLNELRKQT